MSVPASVRIYQSLFYTFSLSVDDLLAAATVFTAILVLVGGVGLYYFYDQPKKLCWSISLVNSLLMTIASVVYIAVQLEPYVSIQEFIDRPRPRDIFYGLNNFNVLVCMWFALANAFDIIFGLFFYRRQLKLLTTWIHHTAFIYIMITCTTGNGLLYRVEPSAPTFQYVLLQEIPTFLLALGSIFPKFRTDLGFGMTFFVLRIFYHTSLMIYAWHLRVDTFVFTCFFSALWVHVHWFIAWCHSYSKPRSKSV